MTLPSPISIDYRLPAFNRGLTFAFADKQYVIASSTDGTAAQFSTYAITSTDGTLDLNVNLSAFQFVTYNNLINLIRAVSNNPPPPWLNSKYPPQP